MGQKMKDGIVIDNTIYITDEKNKGFPFALRGMQLLAILAGSLSIISIFIECLSLPVTTSLIWLSAFLLSFVMFALFYYPSYDMAKLVTSIILYLLILFSRFDQLKNGFFLFENAFIKRAGSYYGFPIFRYRARNITAEQDLTFLVFMILILLVALLAIAVVRNRWTGFCKIILLLPVAGSFLLGILPSEIYLISSILTMLYISRSCPAGSRGSYKSQKFMLHRVNSRAAVVLSLMTLVIFLVMKLFVSTEQYEDASGIRDIKTKIQDFMFSFSLEDISDKLSDINWHPNMQSASGGLNSGELGKVDQVKYNDSEHLRITVPIKSITDGIYLKGYVGSDYTGDSWNGHSKKEKETYKSLMLQLPKEGYQPANGSKYFLQNISALRNNTDASSYFFTPDQTYEFSEGMIEIEYMAADKDFIYAPYHADLEEEGNSKFQQDLYTVPKSKKDIYSFNYYFGISMEEELKKLLQPDDLKFKDYTSYEKLYRDYVYDTYTQLPDKGLERLKEDFAKGSAAVTADSLPEAITYIKNYLHSNTQYTLSPGRLPKGKDFVEYFLYENKVGYCTHYASAATLMLRAMGYPARYVEGYSVSTSDVLFDEPMQEQKITKYTENDVNEAYDSQVEVSVRDYNAHAWVEVYIDGCGWFPVEFTPGSGIEDSTDMVDELEDIGEDIKEKHDPTVTPTPIPKEPTKTPEKEEKKDQPVAPQKNNSDKSDPPINNKHKTTESGNYPLILSVIAGISVVVLFGVIYILYIRRRKSAGFTQNNSKKALLLYEAIEKLLKICRALPEREKCLEDSIDYVIEHCPFIKEETLLPCMEAVKKARFGRETISREELNEVENFHRILSFDLYHNSSFLKKIYLKVFVLA